MKTILTPIDFSPVSRKIVDHAAALARALDARVVLLTVLMEPVFLADYAPSPPRLARLLVGAERTARRSLAAYAARLSRAGVPVSVELLTGVPADRILARARTLRAAFIVLGSHGHSALFELVAGSTTSLVLRKSTCPVVVVPAAPQRRTRPR